MFEIKPNKALQPRFVDPAQRDNRPDYDIFTMYIFDIAELHVCICVGGSLDRLDLLNEKYFLRRLSANVPLSLTFAMGLGEKPSHHFFGRGGQ